MNEIAAKQREAGLSAPLSELATREWDAVVVGGGHNGLTAAASFQGEVTANQIWTERPSPRTPVPGLYLCGAATHPGGSVIALNGRNAARVVLAARLEERAVR